MPVPSTQEIRRALLEILSVGNPRSITVKEWMTLAEKHLGIVAPIQPQKIQEFKGRIIESLQYLMDQHMISNPLRYTYMITKKGQNLLEGKTDTADEKLDILPDDLDFTNDVQEASETPDSAEKLDAMPDDLAFTDDVQEASETPDSAEKLEAMPDDLDFTNDMQKASETPDTAEELDSLPDDLDMTDEEQEASETPDGAEKLDSLPDDLDMTDEEQEASETPDSAEEFEAMPDDLAFTDDEQEISEEPDGAKKLNSLPDNLDMTDDEQEASETPDGAEKLEAMPDDLDFTNDEQKISATPDSTEELDSLHDDLDFSNDVQEVSAMPDSSDTEFDAIPDNLNFTNDEQEISETPDSSEEFEAMPDGLDMTDDEQEISATLDSTEELNSLPDDLDFTNDEPDIPEILDTAAEFSDSFTDTYIDTKNTLDSDTYTLNSIDEVDPDMSKDDLPADNFSTTDTEDFSSAVNQALSIDDVFERHNSELADKVLMRAASLSQEMFAVFVTDLLSKMGYNAFQTARYSPNSSGDSMIQGVILDPKAKTPIYIHADKLSPGRTVGRSDMHDFADELAEKGGTGIFATTGEFSEQAGIYAQDERIMLIDGKKLAGLILANNFCVNVAKVFEVKELDDDSFREYE